MHNNSDVPIHDRPITPDRELLIWEKWIQIRRDETATLGRRLNRHPVDLAMNLLDKVRKDKERKTALEHAQIETKVGPRGSTWERPPRLKQRCHCAPTYELHETQAEKGNPPIIEHIGVPAYIQRNEMGMAGEKLRKQCPKLNAEYKYYRRSKEDDLAEKIEQIDPFRPDIDALIIKGKKPPVPSPKMPPIPDIAIHETDMPVQPRTSIYALKINGTVFKKVMTDNVPFTEIKSEEDSRDHCISWTYYFNVPAKRAGRCKLSLYNIGTVTLRYCWKKIKRMIPFIPEVMYEQVFFFNKNEDVISPGQSKDICFTFIANRPGVYTEHWELSTSNVNFFNNSVDRLSVCLYADAVENIHLLTKKVEDLKFKIKNAALHIAMSKLVEEIFENAFELVPIVYPYKHYFVEAEMFVMKNPVCFYHQTEVNKMKDYYTEMVPKKTWDLSIGTWRAAMMGKEFDDRMKYYELLRKSHADFLKPWYENDILIKEKHRAVSNLLEKFADQFDRELARVVDSFVYNIKPSAPKMSSAPVRSKSRKSLSIDPITAQIMRNVFYIRIYDHLAVTIELCAGVLSSLDLNRWMEFDFCRHD